MKTKTLIARVIVKGKNVPEFKKGMGKGVMYEVEIVFSDERNRGWNSPLFAMAKLQKEDDLLREVCFVEWTEKRRKKKC